MKGESSGKPGTQFSGFDCVWTLGYHTNGSSGLLIS